MTVLYYLNLIDGQKITPEQYAQKVARLGEIAAAHRWQPVTELTTESEANG
jgi:hypothetical protein